MIPIKRNLVLIILSSFLLNCSVSNSGSTSISAPVVNDIDFWLTKGDQTVKLQKQSSVLTFGTFYNNYQNIEVIDTQIFQTVEGFGYTLNGGSVKVINQLSDVKKQELLQELFGSMPPPIPR